MNNTLFCTYCHDVRIDLFIQKMIFYKVNVLLDIRVETEKSGVIYFCDCLEVVMEDESVVYHDFLSYKPTSKMYAQYLIDDDFDCLLKLYKKYLNRKNIKKDFNDFFVDEKSIVCLLGTNENVNECYRKVLADHIVENFDHLSCVRAF